MMIEKVEIKNLKVAENLSEGSLAFTASIWINGKKAGGAKNQGRGGMTDVDLYYWEGDQARRNNELHDELREYVKQFTWEYGQHRVDTYIDELVFEEDKRQSLKRFCRGKTAFRIPGDTYKEGQYQILKHKFTKEVAKALRDKHGKDVFILNETV
jgi:hypothetical protein